MHFELSKEHKMLQKAVREFADKQIAPYADQWDADNYLPVEEAIKPMAELGFIGTVIPEAYGGEDAGWMAAAIITEEIARASSSLRVQINLIGIGCAYPIYLYGTEEARQKYIPKLCAGELLGAFCHPRAGCRIRRYGHADRGGRQGGSLCVKRVQELDLKRPPVRCGRRILLHEPGCRQQGDVRIRRGTEEFSRCDHFGSR